LQAQGEKESAILVAEGEKQSNILKAQGEKESAILRAEAKKAEILAESEGTAEAIKNIIYNFLCLCIEIIGFLWEHKTMRHGSHRDP
jgi:hypothetical protein